MILRPFEYHAPPTLAEACALLEARGAEAMILAGGTDLLVSLKQEVFRPRHLVDVRSLPELHGVIRLPGGGLRLGAALTLAEVIASPDVQAGYPLLAAAAAAVAAPTHQAMGTLGGNVLLDTRCWFYNQSRPQRAALGGECFKLEGSACYVAKGVQDCYATYSGDTAPALLALEASVRLADRAGGRTIPLADLYTGDGKTPFALRPGEILEAVLLPPPQPEFHGVYRKFRLRQALDYPLAGLAIAIRFRPRALACEEARIAFTAADAAPRRTPEAEALFPGAEIDERLVERAAAAVMKASRPVRNVLSTPQYRKAMLGHLCRQALAAIRAAREKALEIPPTPPFDKGGNGGDLAAGGGG